ncbi:MAG: diaminopimelate epimerase [Chloroflexi bacterium]|nr:diaminopimelate epimerase [Chloroflexota bacterium]
MQFVKMHGTGNDFVMIDGRGQPQRDWPLLARRMCDRHFGVGADGLILLEPSQVADLRMRMWNPDGSEAEMCGNGIRCFAKLALERGLVPAERDELRAETGAGVLSLRPQWQGASVVAVQVSMGAPVFEPRRVPVALPTSYRLLPDARGLQWVRDYPLEVGGRVLPVACVSMGNPHAIFFADRSPEEFPLEALGPQVERHPLFPNRVNFHVAQVLDGTHIRMRTWERGAGLTLACGTGACATAVAAFQMGYTQPAVEVRVPGGALTIQWPGAGEVLMTGPAEAVFSGDWPEQE